jgi:hypothetical protein
MLSKVWMTEISQSEMVVEGKGNQLGIKGLNKGKMLNN